MPRSLRLASLVAFLLAAPLLSSSCNSGDSGPVGGPVSGAVDMHCTVNGAKTATEIGMCVTAGSGDTDASVEPDASSTEDAATEDAATSDAATSDGGAPAGDDAGDDAGESGGSDFGDTMYNSEGDDDDCKYHVSWSSSPVRKDTDVTFDVTATKLIDNQPALGANVEIEAFLSDVHPTPSVNITTTEQQGAGKYHVGPVRFDQSGMWTVRFHLYQSCIDSEDSPHGHAAFYVNVP